MSSATIVQALTTKLSSSGKDIIWSGTAHTFDRKSIEFQVTDLQIALEFTEDSNEKQSVMALEKNGEKGLKIKAINFNGSLGTGTTNPLHIGHIQNRKLYISFTCRALSKESIREISFTFYLGEKLND